MAIIESKTAVKHGGGSLPYRWVSGLTDKERAAVRKGELVFFRVPKTHYTQSGYKVVTYYFGKYGFREPNDVEMRKIKAKRRSERKQSKKGE